MPMTTSPCLNPEPALTEPLANESIANGIAGVNIPGEFSISPTMRLSI